MSNRSYIGAAANNQDENAPLKAVDGIIGVVMMLAYYGGGTNIFPDTVAVHKYVETNSDGDIKTNDILFCELLNECSIAIHRNLKSLTLGSMKAYLSWLRNGKRPGQNHELLAVNTTYNKDGILTIKPRYFNDDRDMGLLILPAVPDWILVLAEQKGMCESLG